MSELKCFVFYKCLRTCATNAWYFDNGYSRYMTGNKDILVDYKPLSEGLVTFGDGVTTRVLGKGTLNVENFSQFKNILHIDGLKTNLISISQICDLNLNVNFNREKCVVIDDNGKSILEGFRSPDNYYTFTSPSHTCHKISSDDTKLWHERLGHLNYKSLKKLSNAGAVRGLPKISKQISDVCGPCQHSKQLKTTHKVVQHTSTSKVLELLHMDLMGPMQVESIVGKWYIFVCVDDFLRFTWVYFIIEKSYTFDSFRVLCTKLKNEKNCNIG